MRFVVAVAATAALVAGGCRRQPAPLAAQRSAVDGVHDNIMWFEIFDPTHKVTTPQVQVYQSDTTPAQLFAQMQKILHDQCGGDSACLNAPTFMTLGPENVLNPEPPARPLSAPVVAHFRDGVNAMLSFLQSGAMNAPATRDSLDHLASSTNLVQARIDGAVLNYSGASDRIKNEASQKIKDKAAPIVGAEMAALATAKQTTQAVHAIFDTYVAGAQATAADFATVAQMYVTYRGLESDTTAQLAKLSTAGSASDLAAMPAVQEQLLALDASESRLPESLLLLVYRLQAQLSHVQQQFDQAVAPYVDFMALNGIARPDLTSTTLHSLEAMRGYALAREDSVRKTIAGLVDGLDRRAQALVIQAADAASLPAIVQAEQLAASARFVDDINKRVSGLWTTPPSSTALDLPFEAAQLDRVTTFLQLEATCSDPQLPSYMTTGCKLMQPQLSRAHTFVKTGLPSTIRLDLYFLGQAGADADAIAAVKAELAAGQLEKATLDHDALLHASDVATTPDGGVDGGGSNTDDSEDD